MQIKGANPASRGSLAPSAVHPTRLPLLVSALPPPHHSQIAIALAAPSSPTTRGFLPWRLSDAGPGARRPVAMGRHSR